MGELMDKAKGKIKQVAGALTGNDKLKVKGKAEEVKGEAEGRFKGAEQDIKHAVKDAPKT